MELQKIPDEQHRNLIMRFYLCQVVVQHFGGKGKHAQSHLEELRQATNTLGELGYSFADATLPHKDNGTNDILDLGARLLNSQAVKKCVLWDNDVIQPSDHFNTACNMYIQQLM